MIYSCDFGAASALWGAIRQSLKGGPLVFARTMDPAPEALTPGQLVLALRVQYGQQDFGKQRTEAKSLCNPKFEDKNAEPDLEGYISALFEKMMRLPAVYPPRQGQNGEELPPRDSIVHHMLPLLQECFGPGFHKSVGELRELRPPPTYQQVVDKMSSKLEILIERGDYKMDADGKTYVCHDHSASASSSSSNRNTIDYPSPEGNSHATARVVQTKTINVAKAP